jgi:NTE family protein
LQPDLGVVLGVVLSGGGPRGAYEAGVLAWIAETFAAKKLGPLPFSVIAGTSAGAFNAAFLAGSLETGSEGAKKLEGLWCGLRLSNLIRFGPRGAREVFRALSGGRGSAGILDPSSASRAIKDDLPWAALRENIDRGSLRALTVSVTHVSTGRGVVFVDSSQPGLDLPPRIGRRTDVRRCVMAPAHVMASASIPVLFPPVRIGEELYCDGGLRLNTPLSPAIHLGADRLLVLAVSTPPPDFPHAIEDGYTPGAGFLIGKVLDAFLLDHVVQDIDWLNEVNQLLDDGVRAFGPQFLERLSLEAKKRGEAPRRKIETLVLRPSRDIGGLAGDYLRKHRARLWRLGGPLLIAALDVGVGGSADLASYLLFDGPFVKDLIELGRADARARGEELLEFMLGPGSQRLPATA